ncbi:MAG: hypothetical protein MN733_21790, partial [Nitrososphaera sp.]|nr:hypothetical protein [Nitrososphaera sp.]
YTFEIDTYQVDGSDYYRPPTPVRWRFVGYNTMQLVERICLAAQLLEVNDERLERAIFYFNLSLATYKAAQETTGTNWDWFTGLVSSALLNLYKAATSILGDPSVRADKHQRRIKELRLSSEDIDDFKNLKSFRDSFDVAHYTLNEKESQEIHSVFEKYKAYTSQLIMKYSKNV